MISILTVFKGYCITILSLFYSIAICSNSTATFVINFFKFFSYDCSKVNILHKQLYNLVKICCCFNLLFFIINYLNCSLNCQIPGFFRFFGNPVYT